MLRKTLLVAALACFSVWSIAQSPSASSSAGQTGASASSSGSSMTVDGCLSGSSGSYMLKDKASGTTYNLTGDTSKLSAHVGHEVQITGTPSASSSASSSSPSASASPSGASSSSGGGQTLSVTSIKHVATSCSAQ
jgi:hypothetical protein